MKNILNKIKTYEFLPHTLGSIIGALIGLIFGLFVTKQTNQYDEVSVEIEVSENE